MRTQGVRAVDCLSDYCSPEILCGEFLKFCLFREFIGHYACVRMYGSVTCWHTVHFLDKERHRDFPTSQQAYDIPTKNRKELCKL